MPKQIFRKEAMERMSSPEQLDQLMPVTSRRGWIALTGIGALLVAALLWGVFGSIETTVPASGALMRAGGINNISAPANGEVQEVLVAVGDTVKAGQILVKLNVFGSDDEKQQITIRSRRPGRVLDLAVITGDSVEQGNLLVSLESPSRPMQAILFVSTRDGYKVEPGMQVKITPATANRYTSHFIIGTVTSAGRYPASREVVFRGLQNEAFVDTVTREGPVLEVIVELPQTDEISQFYSGTPCRAEITIAEKPPISFVLPVFGAR